MIHESTSVCMKLLCHKIIYIFIFPFFLSISIYSMNCFLYNTIYASNVICACHYYNSSHFSHNLIHSLILYLPLFFNKIFHIETFCLLYFNAVFQNFQETDTIELYSSYSYSFFFIKNTLIVYF